jgi:hypothetical protein
VVADEAEDLLLGVGDQGGGLEDRLGGGHRRPW